jgi:hypothetical protein
VRKLYVQVLIGIVGVLSTSKGTAGATGGVAD